MDRLAISLFTGAGGLDLGLEKAGFSTCLCVENDKDSLASLKHNRNQWKRAQPADIFELTAKDVLRQSALRRRQATLVAGGPPCQPFSKSGFWTPDGPSRMRDPRAKTLHALMAVVEESLPRVVLIENVAGFAFEKKDSGLKSIKRRFNGINKRNSTNYRVNIVHVNAADYGVPQKRERVFLIASRDGRNFALPPASHGPSSTTGARYTSAWDAIGHLDDDGWPDDLVPRGKWGALLPSIPEGLNYLWHTPRMRGEPLFGWRTRYWSFLLKLAKNEPAWTLQAAPGPATGPFHWRSRLLSVVEMCALQTFPEAYAIQGDYRSAQRQIGNAVPSALGELFGLEIRRQLLDDQRVRRSLRLIPKQRDDCPPAERILSVPRRYYAYRANHCDHPGEGRGPGALAASASQT